jgi:hypothetical protein
MVSVFDHLSAGSIALHLAARSDSWTWPVAYGVAVFVASAVVVLLARAHGAVARSVSRSAPLSVVAPVVAPADAAASAAAGYAVVGAAIGADVGVGWGAPCGRGIRTRRRSAR